MNQEEKNRIFMRQQVHRGPLQKPFLLKGLDVRKSLSLLWGKCCLLTSSFYGTLPKREEGQQRSISVLRHGPPGIDGHLKYFQHRAAQHSQAGTVRREREQFL